MSYFNSSILALAQSKSREAFIYRLYFFFAVFFCDSNKFWLSRNYSDIGKLSGTRRETYKILSLLRQFYTPYYLYFMGSCNTRGFVCSWCKWPSSKLLNKICLCLASYASSLKAILSQPLPAAFRFGYNYSSFLGVAQGLFDFLKDGVKAGTSHKKRILAFVLTFFPPVLLVIFFEQGFIALLDYAGALIAIIMGIFLFS